MHAIVPETRTDVSAVADEPFRVSLGRGTKVLSSGGKGIWHPAWAAFAWSPLVILGGLVGTRLNAKLSTDAFFQAVWIFICVIGLLLVFR